MQEVFELPPLRVPDLAQVLRDHPEEVAEISGGGMIAFDPDTSTGFLFLAGTRQWIVVTPCTRDEIRTRGKQIAAGIAAAAKQAKDAGRAH